MWASICRHIRFHTPLTLSICLYLRKSLLMTGIHMRYIRWYMAILYLTVCTRCTQEASLEGSPLSPQVFLHRCHYPSVCIYVFLSQWHAYTWSIYADIWPNFVLQSVRATHKRRLWNAPPSPPGSSYSVSIFLHVCKSLSICLLSHSCCDVPLHPSICV